MAIAARKKINLHLRAFTCCLGCEVLWLCLVDCFPYNKKLKEIEAFLLWLWNVLQPTLIWADSVASFKNQLKTYIFLICFCLNLLFCCLKCSVIFVLKVAIWMMFYMTACNVLQVSGLNILMDAQQFIIVLLFYIYWTLMSIAGEAKS